MLNVGFRSGCLIVTSNDFKENYESIMLKVSKLALQEWNRFDEWTPSLWSWKRGSEKFHTYYNLNESEKKLFDNKSEMPMGFIEKYYFTQLQDVPRYFIQQLDGILYHKKKPNTDKELIEGLKNQKIYKVKCNICNRVYLMDESSITCVRWQSCVGAECLQQTVSDDVLEYKNLCNVDNGSNALQVLNNQLKVVENITNPLSYYGGTSDLHISYISDIHLLHHLTGNVSVRSLINNTVKRLYETMDNEGIILFAGDISSDVSVTVDFYTQFVKYKDYLAYKTKKKKLRNIQYKKFYDNTHGIKMKSQINNLGKYIENLKLRIKSYLNFNVVARYKKRYHENETWTTAISSYKSVKSYINKNISDKCDYYLDLIANKLDLLTDFEKNYSEYLLNHEIFKEKIGKIESLYNKKIEKLTISDICKKHQLLSDERLIVTVLGNHEYIGFEFVLSAVKFYKQFFASLGIKFLQNESLDFDVNGNHYIIFGGTGFAKYNLHHNADTLVCCKNFTRDNEIEETSLFEKEYVKARKKALSDKTCFICVSHYPIHDCFMNINNDTIYFYGHNHHNYCHRNENEIIYADNQIGYKNLNIEFKTMTTGMELNPYFTLADGLYKTTIKHYLQFYKYIGESIGDGSLLYQRCQNNKASLYVIKRKGYYGFFVLNENKGEAKGISIVNGGKTKKVTKSTDLQWVFNNFEVVLSKYLQVLAPLRVVQEKISSELKELGFSGLIHGCIIDIDFYHHIMLNPVDGTMTYYYSSMFGMVQPISSFDQVIVSIKKHDNGIITSNRNYSLLLQQFNNRKENPAYILGKVNETHFLEHSKSEVVAEQVVSRSEGMYGISRKINSLQKIFSGHVLREFDLQLVDILPILN